MATATKYARLPMFASPFGPANLAGRSRDGNDGALISRTEGLGKPCQRRLHQPWLEDDACGLAVRVKYPRHAQQLQRWRDAS